MGWNPGARLPIIEDLEDQYRSHNRADGRLVAANSAPHVADAPDHVGFADRNRLVCFASGSVGGTETFR